MCLSIVYYIYKSHSIPFTYALTLLLPGYCFFFPFNIDVLRRPQPSPARSPPDPPSTFLHPFAVGNPIKENHSGSNFKLISLCLGRRKMEVGKKKWKLLLNIYHLSAPSKEIGFFNSIMFVFLDLYKHNFFEKKW